MSLTLVLIFVVRSFGRLALNSSECLIYLSKLEQLEFEQRLQTQITPNQNKIYITFGYLDPLFENNTFWGLTRDDGKSIDETCLDLKIWIFKSQTYSELLDIRNPQLSFNNDPISKLRYLSFFIEFQTYLKRGYQKQNYQNVYFGVIYYAAGTNQVLKSQRFEFKFQLNINLLNKLTTKIKSVQCYETIVDQSCYSSPVTQLCTDIRCQEYYFPEFLIVNAAYVIKQLIYINQIKDAKLYLRGNGIVQQIEPIQSIYSSQFAIFQFSISLVLKQFTLESTIINMYSESWTHYYYWNETISCIKINNYSETGCSTCDDQCRINNGLVEQQCHCDDSYSKALILINLIWIVVLNQ